VPTLFSAFSFQLSAFPPPGNTARLSLPHYAHRVANWWRSTHTRPATPPPACLDWALSYDTMGNPLASERDDARLGALLQTIGHGPDPPIVPITHYPGPGAAAIIGDLLRDREDCFDDEELAQVRQRAEKTQNAERRTGAILDPSPFAKRSRMLTQRGKACG
jgi:hypothetical protein